MWRRNQLWASLALAALGVLGMVSGHAQAAAFGEVVISEIMYDSIGSSDVEWIELYNPGSDPVDLSGWVLTDDSQFPSPAGGEGECLLPAGATLPVGGFLAVSRKTDTGIGGIVVCTSQNGTLTLSNSGDNLALFSASGELVSGSLTQNYPDLAGANNGRIDRSEISPGRLERGQR